MNSDSAFNYFEILMLGLFVGGWAILEWQGRRLDRKRAADKAKIENKIEAEARAPK